MNISYNKEGKTEIFVLQVNLIRIRIKRRINRSLCELKKIKSGSLERMKPGVRLELPVATTPRAYKRVLCILTPQLTASKSEINFPFYVHSLMKKLGLKKKVNEIAENQVSLNLLFWDFQCRAARAEAYYWPGKWISSRFLGEDRLQDCANRRNLTITHNRQFSSVFRIPWAFK